MPKSMEKTRKFIVKIVVEQTCDFISEGESRVKDLMKSLGLKVASIEHLKNKRTITQNKSLWLMFTELAEALNEKGIDMRTLIRKEVELSWTAYSINQFLWKPLLKVMTGKKSTTEMDSNYDISLVYDNLNKIIIERTSAEVSLPPWPCEESYMEKMDKLTP